MPKQPTLAATAPEFEDLIYPIGVQPKVDGVCGLGGDVLYSRRLKPFVNKAVQAKYAAALAAGFNLDGLHGEIITDTDGVFSPCVDKDSKGETLCNRTSSMLTTIEGHARMQWHLFDIQDWPGDYVERHSELVRRLVAGELPDWCNVIPLYTAMNARDMTRLELRIVGQGFEGLVVKRLASPYKYGRATVNSAELMRVTLWKTDEARIVGAIEETENLNEAKLDALGKTERSSHKENMRPKGALGAFELVGIDGPEAMWVGVKFKLGTGLSDDLAKKLWQQHLEGKLVGQVVTYRHKPHGAKDAPRFPSFRALRPKVDL